MPWTREAPIQTTHLHPPHPSQPPLRESLSMNFAIAGLKVYELALVDNVT